MPILIRPVTQDDKKSWETLWKGYQAFYKTDIPAAATNLTWSRFLDEAEPVNAFVAEGNSKLFGLVHFIFHRNTWMMEPVCYLQDLFTDESSRGQGIGRKLIEAVYEEARTQKCSRVYWLTHETNNQAMTLYDKLAEKSGFLQYRKQL